MQSLYYKLCTAWCLYYCLLCTCIVHTFISMCRQVCLSVYLVS